MWGYLEVMMWGCGGSCPWVMGWVVALGLVTSIFCYAHMFSPPLEPSCHSLCLDSSGLSLITNLGHDHMPPQLNCSKFPW